MQELNTIQLLIVLAPPLLLAITLHEVAHGWIALRCGDHTAKSQGRLSLNPLRHIDPIGTVLVPAKTIAKAVALMVGQTRPLWDYEDRADWWTRVDVNGMAPVVAVWKIRS